MKEPAKENNMRTTTTWTKSCGDIALLLSGLMLFLLPATGCRDSAPDDVIVDTARTIWLVVNKATFIRAPLREPPAVSGNPESTISVFVDRIDRFPFDVPKIRRVVGQAVKLLRVSVELI